MEDVITSNCSNSYQNLKVIVQPHWEKYFQVIRGGKPTPALFALNWAQYPKVPYVNTEKNDILHDSIQNLISKNEDQASYC